MFVLSTQFILGRFLSIFDALSQFNDDAGKMKVLRLNSRNQNDKNFHRVQKVLLPINLPQKTQKAVSNAEITVNVTKKKLDK